jgi:hypothetical protein
LRFQLRDLLVSVHDNRADGVLFIGFRNPDEQRLQGRTIEMNDSASLCAGGNFELFDMSQQIGEKRSTLLGILGAKNVDVAAQTNIGLEQRSCIRQIDACRSCGCRNKHVSGARKSTIIGIGAANDISDYLRVASI